MRDSTPRAAGLARNRTTDIISRIMPEAVGTPLAVDAEAGRDHSVADQFLARSAVGGDSAALRLLMDRYDRLVRYAVFKQAGDRCKKDPQWLDSVASETWAGFVQSLNRTPDRPPDSVPALLLGIARRRVISQLRRPTSLTEPIDALEGDTLEAVDDDPAASLGMVEDLGALRACIDAVAGEDAALMAHLGPITERRWRAVAGELGIAESTLRSRWAKLLERLRTCMSQKRGNSVAPGTGGGDS